VLAAPQSQRPTYIGADLTALRTDQDQLRPVGQAPWRASRDGDELLLELDPDAGADAAGDPDPVAALRTLCAVHWGAGGGQARVRGGDPAAARALGTLGLGAR
jgi:hypothetical protein